MDEFHKMMECDLRQLLRRQNVLKRLFRSISEEFGTVVYKVLFVAKSPGDGDHGKITVFGSFKIMKGRLNVGLMKIIILIFYIKEVFHQMILIIMKI